MCQSHLQLSFFGLNPSNKLDIHQSIFYFIYGTPGFTFSDVYNMPVHLKNFYLREFMDFKKKELKLRQQMLVLLVLVQILVVVWVLQKFIHMNI